MPLLPTRSAYYIQHDNKCFDFGTFGWFFSEYTIGNPWNKDWSIFSSHVDPNGRRNIDLSRYKYFIFMNSSVRGPFFSSYFIQLVLEGNLNYYWYSIIYKTY